MSESGSQRRAGFPTGGQRRTGIPMRARLGPLWFVVLAFGVSTRVGASVLTLSGSSTLTITPFFPANAPPLAFSMNTSAVPVQVSSGGGGFTEPAGLFTGSAAVPTALFTAVPAIVGFTLVNLSNGPMALAPGAGGGGHGAGILRAGGGFGGPGPLAGTAVVNLFGLIPVQIPLSVIGATGGEHSRTTQQPAGFTFSMQGTGWTTGAVTVISSTYAGSLVFTNPVTFAGFDNRTAAHRGTLQLISPFRVIAFGVQNGAHPGLAVQTLVFTTPEPGTLLLLGSGFAGLALYARRRRRS